MKLHLNICDVDLWLEIYNYKKPIEKNADCAWCNTNFSLKSKYIDYNFEGWEVFLNDEIDYMKSVFKDLLEGKVKKECNVSFAEPDFEFDMSPIRTLYSEPGKMWCKSGSITLDISIDFNIHFWRSDGALGSNVFTMTVDREEIGAFYTYLQLITEEIVFALIKSIGVNTSLSRTFIRSRMVRDIRARPIAN